jgi:peptidoglycan/LPS O-acetylase OafA/YrhL
LIERVDAEGDVRHDAASTVPHVAVMDGLRGVAILWVVWYHFFGLSFLSPAFDIGTMRVDFTFIPQSGYLGVELFFFLSGFVLFFPYARSLFFGSHQQTMGQYVYRRAVKIVPSYYLSLLLIVGLGPWLFFPANDEVHQVFTHLLFVNNFESSGTVAINAVYWSLPIEVQFYVVFPLLVLIFVRYPWMTTTTMSAIAIGYRFWSTACCTTTHAFARYQVPAFLDLFALGMLCAYVFVQIRAKSPTWSHRSDWATVIALVCLSLIVVLLRNLFVPYSPLVGPPANHPEYLFYLAVLIFGFALSTLFAAKPWRRFMRNRVLLYFAVISYNLYLYHLALASSLVARLRFPPFQGPHPPADPHWQVLFNIVAFITVVGVSSLITFVVERPLLRAKPDEIWRAVRMFIGFKVAGDSGGR